MTRTEIQSSNHATRKDIDKLRNDMGIGFGELRKDMSVLRKDVAKDMKQFKTDVAKDLNKLRIDVAKDMNKLRTDVAIDMKQFRADVAKDLKQFRADVAKENSSSRNVMGKIYFELRKDIDDIRHEMATKDDLKIIITAIDGLTKLMMDFKAELAANQAAHDRFESRITRLENSNIMVRDGE